MAKSLLSLLEEEFIDENLQYSSFYEENLEFLRTVSLDQVPDDLKLQIAILFIGTDDYYTCIGFLEDLDVDHITIKRIQFESTASLKPPLYVAFNGVLQDRKSLGDVIEVFSRRQRFDILRHLKEYVESLLNKHNSLDKEIVCSDPSPTAPNHSSSFERNFNHNLNQNNGSCLINYDAFQKEKTKDHKTILNGLQKSKIISSLPISSNRKQLPTAPDIYSSTISVFIMHSMQDRKKAKKLAAILKERNLLVITSAQIQPLLRENRTKIMKVINEKVDFVIPLVTECLMKQIQSTVYSTQEEIDLESEANYFMYDLLLNEYSNQGCINRRVKPVCDSSESRKLAIKDPILSWSFHLQNEAMKLLKELINSKKRLELLK